MVLSEQQLVDTLRNKCDNAKKRIWIASPFIGELKGVQKVIGGKCQSVDCKILTDIKAGFIKKKTFDFFTSSGAKIKSLHSLHAKIYIIDDWYLVTSANLTETAFTRRYEIGLETDDREVENTFDRWWNTAAVVTNVPAHVWQNMEQYQDGTIFTRKFNAPAYTSQMVKLNYYTAKCSQYKVFADIYARLTGRNQNMVRDGYTLLQEVDYFFYYWYRNYPNRPSAIYNKVRTCSAMQRDMDIKQCFKAMSTWYPAHRDLWRLQRSITVQTILAPGNINNLSWNDVGRVVNCFHCYTSLPLNKVRFLNKANNTLTDIRTCWSALLNNGNIATNNIPMVLKGLRFFGESSVQELIGWYDPINYPMMNSASDCGMRYFGFNV